MRKRPIRSNPPTTESRGSQAGSATRPRRRSQNCSIVITACRPAATARRNGLTREKGKRGFREEETAERARRRGKAGNVDSNSNWAVGRRRPIEQIGGLTIPSSTKSLTSMKARVFDSPKTLRPFEMRPTTSLHMDAYHDGPTVRTRMTIDPGVPFASCRAQLPSLAYKDRTTRP
jgi:hypothetical protein